MPPIDKRVERNTQSALALYALLHEMIHEPALHIQNDALVKALKSQGTLSKYVDEARGIVTSSINTLKRICENSLDGGFDALNRARMAALESVQENANKAQRSNKITREGMSKRIAELDTQNQLLRQELLLLTHLLNKTMSQARYYAEHANQDNVLVLCEKEQREIRSFLSISKNREGLNRHPKAINHA